MAFPHRFSLRTFLLAIAAMALLLAAVPQIAYHAKWGERRKELVRWSAGLERQPHKCEDYVLGRRNGLWLVVTTAEQEISADYASYTWDGAMPDPSRSRDDCYCSIQAI